MPYVDWRIRGPQITTCNCDWGCPCQFYGRPTYGGCTAAVAMRIDAGHFGGVTLDGLKWVSILSWPGAIHEGNGEALAVVDERAKDEQRAALLKILGGKEQEPGATYFSVFSSTVTKGNKPLFLPIAFEADIAQCRGRFAVAGIVEGSAGPIPDPVNGKPHRARVSLPSGFEFTEAEFGSSATKATGVIAGEWDGRHAHLAMIDIGPHGPIRA
jgi:hypothetical protein